MQNNTTPTDGPDFPYPVQNDTSKIKKLLVICVVIIGLIGAALYLRKPKKIEAEKVAVPVTPVVYRQLTNSPTEKPKKEKVNTRIEVLNGTGKSGQAGQVVHTLEAAGYNTDNIKTANAETSDHLITTVTAHAEFEDIASNIKETLKSMFPEITDGSANANPNIDDGFDVIIVTGKSSVSITPQVSLSPTKKP